MACCSTFTWADGLVKRGITKELEADDVPDMSPSMQSKPVYERFMELQYVPMNMNHLRAN